MYLQALANLVPPTRLTQQECWEAFRISPTARRLKSRSLELCERLLLDDNGVDARHFALPDLARLFELTAGELNFAFEGAAPKLAAAALESALAQAKIDRGTLGALLVCTCTGYLCPGVSSFTAEALGLRADAYLQDVVGMGCGAAIPTLRSADAFLAANPEATVAVVAVEICSAAFYMDDDPGVIVSACLFGDGASASIWRSTDRGGQWRAHGFQTLHLPERRDALRFEQRNGKLRNLLRKSVPEVASRAVAELTQQATLPPNLRLISHPGGREVLRALTGALPEGYRPEPSAEVLRNYGNLSSPSVLFALENALRDEPDLDDFWISSFGAGFAAHACRLTRKTIDSPQPCSD